MSDVFAQLMTKQPRPPAPSGSPAATFQFNAPAPRPPAPQPPSAQPVTLGKPGDDATAGEPEAAAQATPAPAPAPRAQARKSARKPLSETISNEGPAADWLEPALRAMVAAGVSDVHLTRGGITGELVVDARVDGDLERVRTVSGQDATRIVNRLKTAADLSTSSSSVPGDGRYELPINGFPYRVRAVSLPLFDGGEKLVLRLPSVGPLKLLENVGFTATNLQAVRSLLAKPGGMTLIAGPMGEGKTTTAHATIMAIGTDGKAVIAVEDPVERVLPGVAQIEVAEETGSGFGDIMRFLVRADFDTLFIGEIRDATTAAAAVRMAKAGRRVVSTIHATDNVTAMLRLIELSDDSALSVLDAVAGVISQRLVRKINTETGEYDGRHPIHEVLTINDAFTDKLIENKSLGEIRRAAAATSTTFAENLRELVRSGITDNHEAHRVVGHDV